MTMEQLELLLRIVDLQTQISMIKRGRGLPHIGDTSTDRIYWQAITSLTEEMDKLKTQFLEGDLIKTAVLNMITGN
jgi:hypothetical protein